MRHAKIVCTLGPKSSSREMVDKLIAAGMDVARLNFSHGTHDTHRATYQILRERSATWNRPIAILQDLQGPKIRMGILSPDKIPVLEDGSIVVLTLDANDHRPNAYLADYDRLLQDVQPGDPILLDDGKIVLDVINANHRELTVRVMQGGALRSKIGMHLPQSRISTKALSDRDIVDLRLGLELGVDYVALSFVRHADDILRLRHLIGKETPHIIAKIERPEAVGHLEEILDAADGIMVARGDLGVELQPEKVPIIQKMAIDMANERAKPVIVATQMLESMIENIRPTRAEASDVANAIFDGTDAVMLSGETANGEHPIRAVEMMASIIREVEASPRYWKSRKKTAHGDPNFPNAVSRATVAAQEELGLRTIAAQTVTGFSPRMISSYRPKAQIIALCKDSATRQRMNLYWGVVPVELALGVNTTEALIEQTELTLLSRHLCKAGETFVLCSNVPASEGQVTNFMKLHRLGNSEVSLPQNNAQNND